MQYINVDKYVTDSVNESDEEGDLEVVYGRKCMTRAELLKAWLALTIG